MGCLESIKDCGNANCQEIGTFTIPLMRLSDNKNIDVLEIAVVSSNVHVVLIHHLRPL